MIVLELACVLIVSLYVAMRGRKEWRRLLFLSVSAWAAEDSVIRAYNFYEYSPEWSLFIDRVPLMIILIWPVVISSAYDLTKYIPGPRPLLTALIVLFDASLIEPVAVGAKLWHWNEPGLFEVPPIGILGWAIFAFFAVQRAWIAPLATHAVLLALWWAFFRWVNVPLPVWPFLIVLAVLSAVFVGRARLAIPRIELWLRVPAALFFFVLLGIFGRDDPWLIAWTISFAPPYLAQMLRST
jgi:hypothetical protein